MSIVWAADLPGTLPAMVVQGSRPLWRTETRRSEHEVLRVLAAASNLRHELVAER